MASNNWVIHGNYTKTGKPLLASDPHLSNQIPSNWFLMELNYNGKYVIGSTNPGIPYVMLGKTSKFSWGVTSALSDTSDLFREKLSEDKSQYMVDGEWKDIKFITEEIKVKGKDEPIRFNIKMTHRGPLCDKDVLTSG